MEFNAKVLLLKKVEKTWIDEVAVVTSVSDMRALIGDDITQVNLSKYEKVYYSPDSIGVRGEVSAMVKDVDGDRHFMGDILLLVECNDEKPVDITEETLTKIKEAIELY